MGNHADKKYFAERFNKDRKARLKREEALKIDRIENPEKYRDSRRTRNKAKMILAVAAGMGVNSL